MNTRNEVLFVINNVTGWEELVSQTPSYIQIVVIDAQINALEFMASFLGDKQDITGIHVISHGSEGAINLGSININNQNIEQFSEQLNSVSQALTDQGDILVYACNVAAGEIGRVFIQKLSQMTQSDVAASSNITSDLSNGDWALENVIGVVETNTLAYQGIEALGFTWTDVVDFFKNGAETIGEVGFDTAIRVIEYGSAGGDYLASWGKSFASITTKGAVDLGSFILDNTLFDSWNKSFGQAFNLEIGRPLEALSKEISKEVDDAKLKQVNSSLAIALMTQEGMSLEQAKKFYYDTYAQFKESDPEGAYVVDFANEIPPLAFGIIKDLSIKSLGTMINLKTGKQLLWDTSKHLLDTAKEIKYFADDLMQNINIAEAYFDATVLAAKNMVFFKGFKYVNVNRLDEIYVDDFAKYAISKTHADKVADALYDVLHTNPAFDGTIPYGLTPLDVTLNAIFRTSNKDSLKWFDMGHIPKPYFIKSNTMELEDFFLNPAFREKGVSLSVFDDVNSQFKGMVSIYHPAKVTPDMALAHAKAVTGKAEPTLAEIHSSTAILEERALGVSKNVELNIKELPLGLATDDFGRIYSTTDKLPDGSIKYVTGDYDAYAYVMRDKNGNEIKLSEMQLEAITTRLKKDGLIEHGATQQWNGDDLDKAIYMEFKEGQVNKTTKEGKIFEIDSDGSVYKSISKDDAGKVIYDAVDLGIGLSIVLDNSFVWDDLYSQTPEVGECLVGKEVTFSVNGSYEQTAVVSADQVEFVIGGAPVADAMVDFYDCGMTIDYTKAGTFASNSFNGYITTLPSGIGLTSVSIDRSNTTLAGLADSDVWLDGDEIFINVESLQSKVGDQITLIFDDSIIVDPPVILADPNTIMFSGHNLGEWRNNTIFSAIKSDGSVVVWGNKFDVEDFSPVASSLNGVIDAVEIFSTKDAFAALRSDGSVVAWGDGSASSKFSSVASALDGSIDAVRIFSADDGFAALRADGSVITWGNRYTGGSSSTVAGALDGSIDVVQVFSTANAFAALRSDGSVVTWGYEYDGGDSSSVADALNGVIDVTSVSSTIDAFAALRADGSVITWGSSVNGGDSSSVASALNGEVDVKYIYSTGKSFAALREDGSVIYWGAGGGYLTDDVNLAGSGLNGEIDVVDVYSTYSAYAALRADGSIVTWGERFKGGDGAQALSILDGSVKVHSVYQQGDSTNASSVITSSVNFVQVYSNGHAFAALRSDGSVVSWGDGGYGGYSGSVNGQLNGNIDVKHIFSTDYAFAALRVDGSVVTWGSSTSGGDSSAVASLLNGVVDVVQIYSTWKAFAALRADGGVVTWGWDVDDGVAATAVVNVSDIGSDYNHAAGAAAIAYAAAPMASVLTYAATLTATNVNEGNSGEKNLSFTLTLDKAADQDITANYLPYTSSSTATHGEDYSYVTGLVTIAKGQTSAVIHVPVLSDTDYESDETVTLVLENFTGAKLVNGATKLSATGKIINDDSEPKPMAEIANVFIKEGDSGVGYGGLKVTLSHAYSKDLTIGYRVEDGTAVAGKDYAVSSASYGRGFITIAAGQTHGVIGFSVIGDVLIENTERFKVILDLPDSSVYLSDAAFEGEVSILDNDYWRDSKAPALISQSVNDEQIFLTFSEAMSEFLPTPTQFSVKVDGIVIPVSEVEALGNQVLLTLVKPIPRHEMVSINYFAEDSDGMFVVQDAAGNQSLPISNELMSYLVDESAGNEAYVQGSRDAPERFLATEPAYVYGIDQGYDSLYLMLDWVGQQMSMGAWQSMVYADQNIDQVDVFGSDISMLSLSSAGNTVKLMYGSSNMAQITVQNDVDGTLLRWIDTDGDLHQNHLTLKSSSSGQGFNVYLDSVPLVGTPVSLLDLADALI